MRERVRNAVAIARAVINIAQRSQLPFLAAAVSYYAFLSFLPLLALALVASTALGGPNVVDLILSRFEAVVTPETEQLLRDALESGSGRLGVSVVGTLVVVWSALKVLRALDVAFSTVYGSYHGPSIPGSILNAVVVLAGVPLGIALTAAVPVVVRLVPLGPFQRFVVQAAGIATLVVVFVPMYVVFPNVTVPVRRALPGATLAATGWSLLGTAFSLYVAVAGSAPLYGPLGGLVLLLSVLYAGTSLLLLGAVLNAVLSGVHASEIERLGSGPERAEVDREVARREPLRGRGEREVADDRPSGGRSARGGRSRDDSSPGDNGARGDRSRGDRSRDDSSRGDNGTRGDRSRDDSSRGGRNARGDRGDARDREDPGDGADSGDRAETRHVPSARQVDPFADRQLQQATDRQPGVARTMPEDAHERHGSSGERDDSRDGDGTDPGGVGADAAEFDPAGRAPPEELRQEVQSLRAELESVRDDVDDRTVHRESVERDLRRYVRRRMRRGHARGWGPYLVLLYGTAMTIAAFWLLSDGLAIVAMVVIWLSTLGLYVLMVLFGASIDLLGVPGRVRDAVGDWRS